MTTVTTATLQARAQHARFRLEKRADRHGPFAYTMPYVVRCLLSGRIVHEAMTEAQRDTWAAEFFRMIGE